MIKILFLYFRIKAIESSVKDDDTKWLMYWTCYALFGILEFFSDQLLFWIPLYTLTKVNLLKQMFCVTYEYKLLFFFNLKCLFLIWLMVPGKNGGSNVVYYRILRPFFLKHNENIDAIGKGNYLKILL